MVKLIKFIDRIIGTPLCFLLGLFVRKRQQLDGDRILFIQLWSIGESILTLPAMKALMEQRKDAVFTILCTESNLAVFEAAGLKARIMTVSPGLGGTILSNFRKYDIAVDFEEFLNVSALLSFFLAKQRVGFSHGARSGLYTKSVAYNDKQHVTSTFYDLVKLVDEKCIRQSLPHLLSSAEDRGHARSFLREGKKNIVIVAGAGDSAKSRIWPHFPELCSKLGGHIVFVGSKSERPFIEKVIEKTSHDSMANAAGLLTVKQLFSLIEMADAVISNDTGPVHVASAQQTPTVALYGPNLPARFGALAKNSVNIYAQGSCPLSPCINVHKGQVRDCLYPKRGPDYQKCMKAISVEEVLEAVKRNS